MKKQLETIARVDGQVVAFGRHVATDERDRRHPMRAALAAPAPEEPPKPTRYWWVPSVLDQGAFPHCVGFAWRQFLNTSPLKTRPTVGPHAVEVYHMAQRMDEWEGEEPAYEGTSVRAGAKAIQAWGRLSEYVWAESVEDIRRFVLTRGSVVVGTDWTLGMMRPTSEGYVDPEGELLGGHAYLVYGYSHLRQAFRCVNSWGTGWGQRGRVWMHRNALDELVFRRYGEACSALEVKLP